MLNPCYEVNKINYYIMGIKIQGSSIKENVLLGNFK